MTRTRPLAPCALKILIKLDHIVLPYSISTIHQIDTAVSARQGPANAPIVAVCTHTAARSALVARRLPHIRRYLSKNHVASLAQTPCHSSCTLRLAAWSLFKHQCLSPSSALVFSRGKGEGSHSKSPTAGPDHRPASLSMFLCSFRGRAWFDTPRRLSSP